MRVTTVHRAIVAASLGDMSQPDSARVETMRGLHDELRLLHRGGRLVVAVDGFTDDRSAFADDLAAAIAADGTRVFRASLDAPQADDLRERLVAPFRAGADLDGAARAVEAGEGADGAVLVLDGEQLHRSDLLGLWNWSVWLDAPLPADDADPTMPDRAAYAYASGERPAARASALVDDTDPAHPIRRYADFC